MKIVLDLNKKELFFLANLLYVEKGVYKLVWKKNLRRKRNLYLKFMGALKRAKRGDVVQCC